MERREIIQALILADSFDSKFKPITLEIPRALITVINIPLIDYTIEFLVSGGVEEIFIFCTSHAKKIQDYLNQSKWNYLPEVTIKTVVSPTCLSAGDALREMYNHGLIQNDFFLVSGDVVSNINLKKILQLHKIRKQKFKNYLMTIVFKVTSSKKKRYIEDDIYVAIDKSTGKLLHFDNNPDSHILNYNLDIFKETNEVQLRSDLIDCRIDICSPEILSLFADNFDYQDIRSDFLKGILNAEILGHLIFTYIISEPYASRVKNLRTYNSVCKDIIYRWTYPIVPDNNILGNTSYTLSRHMNYKEKNVKLSRSSNIEEETVIGEGTEIGDNSIISHSTIGRNCKIGNNVTIEGSYIWNNVEIGNECSVIQSIICDGAKILNNCTIQKGCVISYNVIIGPNFNLSPFMKLTTKEVNIEESNEVLSKEFFLGKKGYGRLWIEKNNIDTDIKQNYPSLDTFTEELEKNLDNHVVDEEEKFKKEAREIIHSSIKANHPLDTVVLEINGLKYAFNTNFIDCAVVILNTLLDETKDQPSDQLLPAVQQIFKSWLSLLEKFINNEEDQIELIWALQEYCEQKDKEKFQKIFPIMLHSLYNAGILEEDSIWKWVNESDNSLFVKLSENFLKWLKETEEDEDEEDNEN